MARVRVHNFTISLDGYGAGPRQTRQDPLGVGGEALGWRWVPRRPHHAESLNGSCNTQLLPNPRAGPTL